MLASIAADALVVVHLLFIAFVVGGSLFLRHWPRVAWLHLPAAAWGTAIELTGWICPLTPAENHFRRLAGQAGYAGGFVEHYVIPLIYPAGLTSRVQLALAAFVVAVNLVGYGTFLLKRRRE